MATPEEIKAIAGLYVAYFDRAPDPAGLEFWINQLDKGRDFATISQDFADSPEAAQIYPFLANPNVAGLDATNLVTSIYQNLFGREPEAQGLNFWVDVVNSGKVAIGDMVEAVMMGAQDAVVNGELVLDKTTVENRIECALEFGTATSLIPGFVFDTQAYNVARAVVDGVDATQASVDAAKLTLADYLNGEGTQSGSTFTLCEHVIEVSPEIVEEQLVTNTVIYWGFNPHGHDETDGVDNTAEPNTNNLTNEGPEDGGIPADAFFGLGDYAMGGGYLQQITGADFFEIFEVDVNNDDFPVIDFTSVRDITVNAGDGGAGTITFQYSDGSADDIAIAADYFALLRDLIFDEEGNSRFFEKEVAADVPVYLYTDGSVGIDAAPAAPLGVANGGLPIGVVDAVLTTTTDAVYATIPPILTPSTNNGGTFEPGFTDQGTTLDDLIVAGTLDLLHTAIIDGGLGYNTLEIDAKGHFAQPKSLVNIQQISIENLPNVYTGDEVGDPSGEDNASQYPDVIEDDDPDFIAGDEDSVIDLTRARDLENVTVTEGGYDPLDAVNNIAGDLHVVGLRNDATLTLQGGFFDGDVYVETSEGFTGDGFTVILDNVNAENTMFIADNGPTLNLVSQGGGNYFVDLDEFNNGAVRELNVSGEAHLFIESNLEQIFDDDTPATINASENSGGVDLNIDEIEQITFIGSQANDRIAIGTEDSSNTEQGPDFANDESITIFNAEGDNYYDLRSETITLTDGDGDNNVEFDAENDVTITMGDGDNRVEGDAAHLTLTLGDGDNLVDLELNDADDLAVNSVDDVETGAVIDLGDGANRVVIHAGDDLDNLGGSNAGGSGGGIGPIGREIDMPEITITAGNGGNTILMPQLPIGRAIDSDFEALTVVDITTGSGNDDIRIGGSDVTIKSGGGDDSLTLMGIDNDYVTAVFGDGSTVGMDYNYKGFLPSVYGVTLDIDTGSGSSVVNLGAYRDNLAEVTGAIVAKENSSITGNDITLFVNTDADLRAATLDGITAIVMDDDNRQYSGQGYGDNAADGSNAASLTLLDTQVAQLLAEGVDFSTQGETFGAKSVLTIVITDDVVLSDLIDLTAWNDSVKLCFVVEDGASLTMTAEELHNYVTPNGIAVDDQNNFIDNEVIITNAGPGFNAYDDAQNGGIGGGSVAGDTPMQDVTVLFTEEGFERPEQTDPVNLVQWDSDVDNDIDITVYPFAVDLEIFGAADISVNGPVILGDAFTVDFSGLTGDFVQMVNGVPTLTIANFQAITPDVNDENPGDNDGNDANDGDNEVTGIPDPDDWGYIVGNGTEADPARVNMLVVNNTSTGDSDLGVSNGGFVSSGVQQFVLTGFHTSVESAGGPDILSQAGAHMATIVVCDSTEDLEVLGLQNNRNAMVTFEQVNWGTEILMEGDGYANASDQEKNLGNPDFSEVGYVTANFFEAGANATVRVNNQGTELGLNEDAEDGFDPNGERKLVVAGVELNNADRLLLAVEDGDAIVEDVSGNDIERIIVTGPEDVEIVVASITPTPGDGVESGKFSGLDSDDLVAIDASGVAGKFTLTLTGPADLSGVTLTGVDMICIDATDDPATMADESIATLTMTADQLVALGADNLMVKNGTITLNVEDMGDQALALSEFVDTDPSGTLAIGSVTFVDEAVTVDPATDFGGATSLIIPEDSEVTMTVAQFETADAAMDAAPTVTDGDAMANADDNKLILTDVPNGEPMGATAVTEVDLANVGVDVDVDIVFDNFVANDNFDVSAMGGETTTAVISGTTDLSAGDLGTVDCVVLQDGAVLTLSQAQIQTLLMGMGVTELSDVIKLADGATATLNINEIDGTGAGLDLNELVADWAGALDIGTLTIANTDGLVDLSGTTWTTGGADEIITPTADATSPEFGTESTVLTLNMSQFLDLDGIGFISGESVVNITDLANTMDGGDSGTDPDSSGVDTPDTDTVDIDTTGITARKGVMTLIEDGPVATNGEAVFLTDTSDISGFEIILTDGQIIGFATEAQASGAVVTEAAATTVSGNPTGILWLFDTWSGTPIDTSEYDSDIDTLFVYDRFVNGQNEEAIWTTLASSIVVQKFNDEIPVGLAIINRVNTFEPFTTAPDGITFDDPDDFQTIGILTLNLEGNVVLGDVTVAESAGGGAFDSIVINSTFDNENDPSDANVILQPNVVGDINILAPLAPGLDLNVLIDTSDDQPDPSFANGGTGAGSGNDLDDGLAISVGTINLGTPGTGINSATVDLLGDHDITIAGLDYSDPALTQVNVLMDLFDFGNPDNDITIGATNIGDLSEIMNLSGDPDMYLILNNFTATMLTDLDDALPGATPGDEEIILATDGNVDLKAQATVDNSTFDIDGVQALSAGVLNLTGEQLAAIMIQDGNTDGIADNWVLGPGVNPGDVTINICDLDTTTPVNLDAIAAAGFNIGTITITQDQELNPGTTLGDADNIVIELGHTTDPTVTLEMTAEQFDGFSGIITETIIPIPASTTADYKGQVIVDNLEALEEGTDVLTVDIDFSQVATTGDNATMLGNNNGVVVNPAGAATIVAAIATAGDGDVILTDTSILNTFNVYLNDVPGTATPNELAGHTIRFSTTEQADGRGVLITGPEGTDAEQDTNVVWLFDTLGADGNPGLDVSGYDENLGRIWVSDDLVETMAGNNIELLFTIDDPDNPGTPLFTLEEGIIKRIESGDLTDALAVAQPFAQTIEIVSGTGLAGLMAEITDPIIFLEQLTIDLGGVTNNGDLEIDNLLGISVLGDDDFVELTLNSFIGDFYVDDSNKHYLLPDDFSIPPGALPSDALQFPNPANVFGDILAGGDRGVLRDITINTGVGEYLIDVTPDAVLDGDETLTISWTLGGVGQPALVVTLTDATDAVLSASEVAAAINTLPSSAGIAAQANGAQVVVNDNGLDTFLVTGVVAGGTVDALAAAATDPAGERGTALEAQTIFFSEDTTPEVGKAGAAGVSDLEINGVHDVTLKGIDTTDAEIIVANLDLAGHTGTLTVTGGSAAFTGGASTEKLIIGNGSGAVGTALFGGQNGDNPATAFTQETDFFVPTEVGGQVQAGIDGEELSKIDTSGHGGTVNLGIVSQIDGSGLTTVTQAGFDPAEMFNGGFNDGFILDNLGTGTVILCLGAAETTADGVVTPTLDAGGQWTFNGPGIELEMKEVVLNGTLDLNSVDLCITGDIDFTTLEALNISGTTTIEVKAGATLTLTVEQVDDLEDGTIVIFGEGTVAVTGESDSADGDFNTTFGAVIQTATMDLSAVTLEAADTVLEIDVEGAVDDMGNPLEDANGDRVAQTVIGSANNDQATFDGSADDGDATTIDLIFRLGADSGDIGVPAETPTTNTPVDMTPEVLGDVIIREDNGPEVQVEVDAGFDTLQGDTLLTSGFLTGDVFQVAAGTEFYGRNVESTASFIATADSSNDGIAVLEADNDSPEVLDLSDATGANGWTLIGGPDLGFGDHTIRGSDQDDTIIDGTADDDDNMGEEDEFTGNGGADMFNFGVERSQVAEAALTVVADGADFEEIDVNYTTGATGETLRFEFNIGATSPAFVTIVDPGTDFSTAPGVAAALAAAINARPDASATVTGDIVTARGIDGRQFDLLAVVEDPNATTTGPTTVTGQFVLDELDDMGDYADDPTDPEAAGGDNDDRTEVTLDFTGIVNDGEMYTITVRRSDGSEYEANHTVSGGETLQQVVDALAADLNANSGTDQLAYSVGTGAVPADATQTGAAAADQIVIHDTDQRDGGFEVVLTSGGSAVAATSSVIALGSSSILDGTETSLADADADVITDFMTGMDMIDFAELAAGDGSNYAEGAAPVTDDFVGALADATAEFTANGTTYYMTSTSADGGLLFYDVNGDGDADGVVNLTGVDATTFAATDIA